MSSTNAGVEFSLTDQVAGIYLIRFGFSLNLDNRRQDVYVNGVRSSSGFFGLNFKGDHVGETGWGPKPPTQSLEIEL